MSAFIDTAVRYLVGSNPPVQALTLEQAGERQAGADIVQIGG